MVFGGSPLPFHLGGVCPQNLYYRDVSHVFIHYTSILSIFLLFVVSRQFSLLVRYVEPSRYDPLVPLCFLRLIVYLDFLSLYPLSSYLIARQARLHPNVMERIQLWPLRIGSQTSQLTAKANCQT